MGKVVGRIQKRISFFSYREWGTGYVWRMGMTANFCEKRETTFEPLPATERRFGGVSATPIFVSGHMCVYVCIFTPNLGLHSPMLHHCSPMLSHAREHMPVREEDVLDSPNQSATLRLSDPDYMLVDISRRPLEIFPHGRVCKVFFGFSHASLLTCTTGPVYLCRAVVM